MLKLIIYKELREIIGSTKFAVTFGVCSLLIIFSFYTGIKEFQIAEEEYNVAIAENLRTFEGITEWNEVNGFALSLPPQPLDILVVGVTNDIGRNITINPGYGGANYTSNDSRYSQHPVFAVFRVLDLEFVFKIILSLFAILFAYDAISGEKEKGTLRLTFSNSLPRASYIWGKLFGSFLAMLVPLLVPILVGILLLPLMGVELSANEWVRLSLIILSGFLYVGVFLTLSVFVSSLVQSSSSSFLLLLVVWVFIVLVLPRSSVIIAGQFVEVPLKAEIETELAQFSQKTLDSLNAKLSEFNREQSPQRRGVKDGDDTSAMQDAYQAEIQEYQVKMTEYITELYDGLRLETASLSSRLNENRQNRQNVREKLAFNIARVSPAAAYTFASSSLSGTSKNLKEEYLEQAVSFQSAFSNFISSKMGREPGSNVQINFIDSPIEETQKKETINTQEFPVFQFEQHDLSMVIEEALPDLVILLFFNLLFFMGAFVVFLRYDLR